MKGENIVLLTMLFKKYIEMGLVCTNIHWILEEYPKRVYAIFRETTNNNKNNNNCAYGKYQITTFYFNALMKWDKYDLN